MVAKSNLALHLSVHLFWRRDSQLACNNSQHLLTTIHDSTNWTFHANTYQINQYQNIIHAILTSVTKCLSSHHFCQVVVYALNTLLPILHDHRMPSYTLILTWHVVVVVVVVQKCSSSSVSTRVQDECNVGTAYTLFMTVLDQVNDNVSALALYAHWEKINIGCLLLYVWISWVPQMYQLWYIIHNEEENRNNNIHRRIIKNMSFNICKHVIH